MKCWLCLALALLMVLASTAVAQVRAGNIYGTVLDEQGAVLPGVTITLTGENGIKMTTTGAGGDFRFLSVDAGAYSVLLERSGFAKLKRDVAVTAGENVNLPFTMKIAAVEETLEVVAETPLVDVKKRGTSTTMIADELEKIPNARDPWGVLRGVPGVIVDRVNIAGNTNGQQVEAGGHGSVGGDKMWNLDGLVITDMSATGGSPSYFDFEAFQEINVSTGGADLNVQTGGLGINLVTKRGTNTFHGGGRFLVTDDSLQSSNLPEALKNDPRLQNPDGSFRDKADHIENLKDFGGELGGPILKDRLWFYGTWGRQDIKLTTLDGVPDDTLVTAYNAKIGWQASRNTMVSAFWFDAEKEKWGRLTGWGRYLGLTETADFRWNQDNLYVDNPWHGLWKLQVDQTLSPNFFVSAKAAYYNTGFTLIAAGGPDQGYTYDYAAGKLIGSYYTITQIRPQKTGNLDGSYFFQGLNGQNELKFGFGYRSVTTQSQTHYNGNGISGTYDPANDNVVAKVHRDGLIKYEGRYLGFYVGDVYTKNRLSVNVGIRFDQQKAKNDGSEIPGNAGLPDLLPALSYGGNREYIINWKNWSPRLGLSYSFDARQKTVGRLSYARYAEQLSFGNVVIENPVAPGAFAYAWDDRNGDHFAQADEVLRNQFLYSYGGVNPEHPAGADTPQRIDRNYSPGISSEVIAGLDHELMDNFAAGIAYVWRKNTDLSYTPRLAGACDLNHPTIETCPIITADEYLPVAPVTSNGFTVLGYSPPSALVAAASGGRILTEQPGYSQDFNGVDLTLTKRMSDRWMGRVALTYNLFRQHYDRDAPRVNGGAGRPGVGSSSNSQGNPTPTDHNSLRDDLVAAFYESPKWQIYANGLVHLGRGLDLSGALFGRQGQIAPQFLTVRAGADGVLHALATPTVEDRRLDSVWDVDVRLAKSVKIDQATVTLSAEGFNLFNANTTLRENGQVNSSAWLRIAEVMNPRIFRLGVRLAF